MDIGYLAAIPQMLNPINTYGYQVVKNWITLTGQVVNPMLLIAVQLVPFVLLLMVSFNGLRQTVLMPKINDISVRDLLYRIVA